MLALVVVLVSLSATVLSQSTAPMPLAYPVRGNSLRVDLPGFTSISVQRGFRYAGGQRFILKGVADAEQHAFAEAGVDGAIARFYWFQFESLLPSATGAYDYSQDASRSSPVWSGGPRCVATWRRPGRMAIRPRSTDCLRREDGGRRCRLSGRGSSTCRPATAARN